MTESTNNNVLGVEVLNDAGVVRLVLDGELDIATVPLLEAKLNEVEASNPTAVLVDLDGVRFIDSSGLRALIETDVRSRERGSPVRLTRGSPQVQRLFRLAGADSRLSFVDE